MRLLSHRLFAAGIGVTLFVTASCSDTTDPGVQVATVLTRVPSDSLFYGQTMRALSVAVGDSATVAHAEIAWMSSDTAVAIVDATGTILGVGIGAATITASFGGKQDSFVVRVVLQRVDAGVAFADGSGSYAGQCALSSIGEVYCRTTARSDPRQVYERMPGGEGLVFSSIHTALNSQCGLVTTGQIYCWGRNAHWIFASREPGRADDAPTAVKTDLRFKTMMTAGHSSICGVSAADDVLYCWGHNDLNQLGREPAVASDSVPAPVAGNIKAKMVSGSNSPACALDLAGAAYCWAGSAGELGIADTTGRIRTPMPVTGGLTFASIAAGDAHRCAIDPAGDAYCWGSNGDGALGIGTTVPPPDIGPQRVVGGLKFASLTPWWPGTSSGTCGITLDGDLYCWGAFTPAAIHARIGARATTPYQIARGVKFRGLSRYFEDVCGITEEGHAVCW